MSGAVFAHQGGWDEILFVLTPLAVFAWLLHVARKRADAMDAAANDPERDGADDTADAADDADA